MQKLKQQGMTLIELTVVLLILVALAGLAIPYVGGTNRMALCQATDASMQAVKTAIMGGGANSGFYMDTLGYYPKDTKDAVANYNLRYLYSNKDGGSVEKWKVYNPKTAVGWRGPYLMSGFNVPSGLNDSFKTGTVHTDIQNDNGSHPLDAWGRPIIIQVPPTCSTSNNITDCARLVSAGSGSGMGAGEAVINTTIVNETASDRGDDRVLFLKTPDPVGNIPCNNY